MEAIPIKLKANPSTKDEDLANLRAFSNEGRRSHLSAETLEVKAISSIPRIRKCYGWLRLSGQAFREIPTKLRAPSLRVGKIPRTMSAGKEYIAIAYEYIEEGENRPAIVEKVTNFFCLAGFSHTNSPASRNWKSGVLVDLSDIVHPGGISGIVREWLEVLPMKAFIASASFYGNVRSRTCLTASAHAAAAVTVNL
ncbi:hypothetical protein AK830_g4297 [Neonectria ditissima]|uniref:Uncharacterized protein n=1 Tax=Neonectria ditissima TaxID=78410 RepID=A0A0P7AWB5_9HYPO|nr:hypothetical protein AK830_g4297 [Neonectria ditissima]